MHREGGQAHGETPHHALVLAPRLPADDRADVRRGAAHVEGERVLEPGEPGDPGRSDHACSRAGEERERRMRGRVLQDALSIPVAPPALASYEDGAAAGPAMAKDAQADPAILERLKSLGYLGGDTAPGASSGETVSSPQGERNLAGISFESGEYEKAAAAYRKLIEQNPEDGALHASLSGALGALGRYDEALAAIETAIRLEPLNAEAYHNRGQVYYDQDQYDLAVADYTKAIELDPDYA